MKKLLTAFLAAVIIAALPGCSVSTNKEPEIVNLVSSSVELRRPDQESVYGNESSEPPKELLEESSSEASSLAPTGGNAQEDTSSQPEPASSSEPELASSSEPELASSSEPEPASSSEPELASSSEPELASSSEPVSSSESAPVVQEPEKPVNPSESSSGVADVNIIPLGSAPQTETSKQQVQTLAAQKIATEVRGVWISYLSFGPLAKNQTETQFRANMDAAFKKIADFGCNTVFAQVRPFGDALYPSKYFPWSHILTGEEGTNPGYDPLKIMCELADQHDLRIEAWLNPYRISPSSSHHELEKGNPAHKLLKSGGALSWNGGVYYNPGSAEARKLILNGVKEIVSNYEVDGVHFDDYFYPTTDLSFDEVTYQESGSSLTQEVWRRENVNILVREVYAAIKAIKPECLFGISPQGNVENNYDGQFIDVAKWLANPGYLDYICPQIYFGFDNTKYPYAATVERWNNMIKVPGIKLYAGLAAYKLGTVDEWAGDGKNEWLNTTDILARMVETAREASHYGGFALYSYDSLFVNQSQQIQAEKESLRAIL